MEFTALLLLAFAAAVAYRRLWSWARARARPSACRVAQVRPGWVELRGRVCSRATLRSPLRDEPVVGYTLEVDEERGLTAWDTVVSRREIADFELEDETGRILVRASTSAIALETGELRGSGGPFRAVPDRVVALLQRQGRCVTGVLFARAFRWRERTVRANQRVRVRAWATEVEAQPERAPHRQRHVYRGLPRRFVLWGDPAHPLRVASDE